MSLTLADVQRWNSGQVREVFQAATNRAQAHFSTAQDLSNLAVFTSWEGDAADAAGHALAQTRRDLDAHGNEALAVARAARLAADGIDQVQAALKELVSDAEQAGYEIDLETGAISPMPGRQHGRNSSNVVQTLQSRLRAIIDDANNVDDELAQAINMADGDTPIPVGADGKPEVADAAAPPLPPAGASDTEVKKWWDGLSDEQKQALIHNNPDLIGGLNGVPPVGADKLGRNAANVKVMEADLAKVQQAADRAHVSTEEAVKDPGRYGLTAMDVTRYNNAAKTRQGMADLAKKSGAETYLYVYEPEKFDGQGRAVVAIGDPDLADNTAVVVPGTGNSVASGWLSSDDAPNLYQEMRAADGSRSNSVIAWMGYDAPDSPTDGRIATTMLAHEGGAALSGDVNALNATHAGDGHLTVSGHSYGSTTVADAAAGYGMRVDDVILVGCPGTDMADSAADFHLPENGHLYIGSASGDPISDLGTIPQIPIGAGNHLGLGSDPAADGFGSTRFRAERPDWGLMSDHTHYYELGSESLYSMGDIASGHGDQLQEHGMTAPHRNGGIPVLSDPEFYRLNPTKDHYHGRSYTDGGGGGSF